MTEKDDDTEVENGLERRPFLVRSPVTAQNRPLSPFVFAAPHSGRYYPETLIKQTNLDAHRLRISEDAWVDDLFDAVTGVGATQLVATYGRSYLDLNRAADELDPDMFTPPLNPSLVNDSYRVRAGLGVIPRLVAPNEPIYTRRLPAREAVSRIDKVYHQYHSKLQALLGHCHTHYGHAVLIDCHSMPSQQVDIRERKTRFGKEKAEGGGRSIISSIGRKRGTQESADIVLGDLWGASCDTFLTSTAEKILLNQGFKVIRNIPYAGGYGTQNYGDPSRGYHALQIEINRALYMDEQTLELKASYKDVKRRLTKFSIALMKEYGRSFPLAAE